MTFDDNGPSMGEYEEWQQDPPHFDEEGDVSSDELPDANMEWECDICGSFDCDGFCDYDYGCDICDDPECYRNRRD